MERQNDASEGGGKIKIGVCVMEKKVSCSPMEQILERLHAFGEFEIVIFGDKVILEDPIESWPLCDCLIAFYSAGYPLEKAEKYAVLRRPFLVNELDLQYLFHDRSKVYEHLKLFGVPVPTYAVVRREHPNQELNYFAEQDDFIEIHGKRFCKPFVEKPIDGDDHNIMIYYPSYAGGGMKELFRKVGNRSSEFYPDVRKVRRDGSYIYEEFMPTGGTDVKIWQRIGIQAPNSIDTIWNADMMQEMDDSIWPCIALLMLWKIGGAWSAKIFWNPIYHSVVTLRNIISDLKLWAHRFKKHCDKVAVQS